MILSLKNMIESACDVVNDVLSLQEGISYMDLVFRDIVKYRAEDLDVSVRQ